MNNLIKQAENLTPIECHDGILYKRDDLFQPFPDEPLNGGKVRQAINLIHDNLEIIHRSYNSAIATTCQKGSPQGLIISRVAKAYNLGCFIGYGNISPETLSDNKMIKLIRENGGIVESIINQGFDNAIVSRLKKLQSEGKGNRFFIIKFGIEVDKNSSVVDCISEQVRNLPDDLEHLVVPTGSGITAGSILRGLQKYNKKIGNVHVVHVSGMDRREKIHEISGLIDYKYVKGTDFTYNRKVKCQVSNGFVLDEIYEAKAHHWMMHNIDVQNERTLFWVVGNANFYR